MSAGSLREAVRAGDLIARFGGDEFLVLLERTSEEAAMRVSQSMLKSLRRTSFCGPDSRSARRRASASAWAPASDAKWVSVLERADTACYEAKKSGGNCVRQFGSETADRSVPLRRAKSRERFLSESSFLARKVENRAQSIFSR